MSVVINRSSELPQCLLQLIIHHPEGVAVWPRTLPDRQNHNNNLKISHIHNTREIKPRLTLISIREMPSLLKPLILGGSTLPNVFGQFIGFCFQSLSIMVSPGDYSWIRLNLIQGKFGTKLRVRAIKRTLLFNLEMSNQLARLPPELGVLQETHQCGGLGWEWESCFD